MAPVSQLALRSIDGDVWGMVIRYSYLPAAIANWLVYTGKKDCCLGFAKLALTIVLKAGWKFINNQGPPYT